MKHTLPQLPYAYDALEPFIDARTLEIHHTKHHQSYVDKLNAALADHPELQDKTVEELIGMLDKIPEAIRTTVRNNAGGHFSHSLYWSIMSPTAQKEIPQELEQAIIRTFGTVDGFKGQFSAAAAALFGSGWVWLVLTRPEPAEGLALSETDKHLKIVSTAGHDNPLMTGDHPLMVLDVWEHAYYLHYQNRRPEYIENWWNIVDWKAVGNNYSAHA